MIMTDKQIEEAQRLRDAGTSAASIALKMGVSKTTIYNNTVAPPTRLRQVNVQITLSIPNTLFNDAVHILGDRPQVHRYLRASLKYLVEEVK